jgi:hypothetical protein
MQRFIAQPTNFLRSKNRNSKFVIDDIVYYDIVTL